VLLLGAAIEAAVQQRSAGTPLHHLCNGVSVGFIREHPRPASELKDTFVAAKALADMNADVEVEADLDVISSINLAHVPTLILVLSPAETALKVRG